MPGIAIYQHGTGYAAVQSQTMMAGALALVAYSVVVCHVLIRARLRALPATLLSLFVWLIVAFQCVDFRRRADMTPIRFSPSSLKEGRSYEYVVRFTLGGAATVFTGLVSSRFWNGNSRPAGKQKQSCCQAGRHGRVSSKTNSTVQQQDASKIKGLPGNKSRPAAKQPEHN
jgi:hypothetical protein